MNKLYIVYYGINYGEGETDLFNSLDEAKEDIDLCISKNECDYFEVYEYVLIDGKYIKSQDTAVYEVKG